MDRICTSTASAHPGAMRAGLELPRRFALERHRDVSGVTGVGDVATGVAFSDVVLLRWPQPHPSVAIWDSVDAVLAAHGHDGATTVRWLDDDSDGSTPLSGRWDR